MATVKINEKLVSIIKDKRKKKKKRKEKVKR